jgi:ribosomal protein L40E
MQSLRELISRLRSWQGWRLLRRAPAAPLPSALPFLVTMTRPIYREVTTQGVRVYSLCGTCGAQLSASATLCDGCAQRRSRSAPNA